MTDPRSAAKEPLWQVAAPDSEYVIIPADWCRECERPLHVCALRPCKAQQTRERHTLRVESGVRHG